MKKFLTLVVFCFWAVLASAQEITVAAAADLAGVFPEVAARFEQQTGHKVHVNFGSSGNFMLQMQNGAPFDLFFSADVQYPRRLLEQGLAEQGTLYHYAVGRLVLWVPNGSTLDLRRGLHVLESPQVKRIAIANPAHAPYGRAAVEALKHEGLYEAAQPRFVMGENISQTAQFVQSGNADAGLIALSLALGPNMRDAGRYVLVPETDHAPLEQAAVQLKNSKEKQTAAQFLEFVKRPEIVRLMEEYGFTVPGGKK